MFPASVMSPSPDRGVRTSRDSFSPVMPQPESLVLKARIYAVEERLAFDEPLHVSKHEIERARRVLLLVVGRAMRRDDEIGQPPERRGGRQRLRIEHIEDGAELA